MADEHYNVAIKKKKIKLTYIHKIKQVTMTVTQFCNISKKSL